MKRISLTLMLCLLAMVGAWSQSRVLESLEFHSEILGRTVKYSVYLPDGYESSTRSYPTLYLLHGWTDDETSWIQMGNMQPIMDKAIQSESTVDMVVVMPDARETWYVNAYDGKDSYEDMFFKELIPYMEKTYRLRKQTEYRAIAGLSMGGYGALLYAIHHPEYFSVCAPLSAAVYTEEVINKTMQSRRGNLFEQLFGKKVLTDHWYQNSILHLLDKADVEKLSAVKFYIDCGDDDGLLYCSIAVHEKMKAKNIPHEFRVRDGNHCWTYWRTGLPSILQLLGTRFKRS